MQPASVQRRPLTGLLVDQLLYWVLTKVRQRALKKPYFGHLFVQMDDMVGMRVIATGEYESTHVDALRTIIGSRDFLGLELNTHAVAIDIGANIGLYSIFLSRYFENIVAIEANPVTVKVLEANLAISRALNVLPICRAVSDSAGQVILYVPENGNIGWSTLEPKLMTEHNKQLVIQSDTLDNILASSKFCDKPLALLKIDVEGHELSVLRGAAHTLWRWGPVIIFEMTDADLGWECMVFLRSLGYKRFYRFRRGLNCGSTNWKKGVQNLFRGLSVHPVAFESPAAGHENLVLAARDGVSAARIQERSVHDSLHDL